MSRLEVVVKSIIDLEQQTSSLSLKIEMLQMEIDAMSEDDDPLDSISGDIGWMESDLDQLTEQYEPLMTLLDNLYSEVNQLEDK